MVSKNNRQILKQSGAKQTPHYGLRKLSIGVASVLLSTTLYMGATTAYADINMGEVEKTAVETNNKQQDQQNNNIDSDSHQTSQAERTAQQSTTGVSKENLPVDSGSNHQPTTAEKSANDVKQTDGYTDVLHSPAQANEPNRPAEKIAQNVTTLSGTVNSVDPKKESQPVNATSDNQSKNAVEVEQTNDKSTLGDTFTSPMPTDAWQPTPLIQVSKDHVATIDTADQPLMVQGDGWQMSLDKNHIKIGDNATLTIKYFATKPGDVFVLDVGYPSGDLYSNH